MVHYTHEDKKHAKEETKSRRMDYKSEDSPYASVRFIFECGYKLKLMPITIASAATIFHEAMSQLSSEYDKYLIATTSLYISCKLNESKFSLRDVLNVAHNTLNRGSEPLDLKDEYWLRRNAVIQAELFVMRQIKFQPRRLHPHKYLLHYLSTLKSWLSKAIWDTVPIAQTSMAFLQDFYHSPDIIKYDVRLIALASIHLAVQSYGVVIPAFKESEDKLWFTYLQKDATSETIWNIIDSIMEVYE